MERRWHTYNEYQSAFTTTKIRDHAHICGFETDYSRIGWTTTAAVRCTDAEWVEILKTVEQEG